VSVPWVAGCGEMAPDRLAHILGKLSSGGNVEPGPARLCTVCASVAGMTGAGIMFMSEDMPRGSVGSTDEVSRVIEELQYTLGEGPSIDANELGRPVVEADLAAAHRSRWTAFTPPALEAGARAVFGLPIVIGAVRSRLCRGPPLDRGRRRRHCPTALFPPRPLPCR
jgi:hypothetical protein